MNKEYIDVTGRSTLEGKGRKVREEAEGRKRTNSQWGF